MSPQRLSGNGVDTLPYKQYMQSSASLGEAIGWFYLCMRSEINGEVISSTIAACQDAIDTQNVRQLSMIITGEKTMIEVNYKPAFTLPSVSVSDVVIVNFTDNELRHKGTTLWCKK